MPGHLRLDGAVLEARGPAGAFVLSDEQVAELGGGRKAFPVIVTVNGNAVPLRLARMGGENLIGLSRANRTAAGVEVGGTYAVEISADEAERTVEVPDDLAAALAADDVARAAYERLAYSHRKEYVRWIVEAKRPETRASRVAGTIDLLRGGDRT